MCIGACSAADTLEPSRGWKGSRGHGGGGAACRSRASVSWRRSLVNRKRGPFGSAEHHVDQKRREPSAHDRPRGPVARLEGDHLHAFGAPPAPGRRLGAAFTLSGQGQPSLRWLTCGGAGCPCETNLHRKLASGGFNPGATGPLRHSAQGRLFHAARRCARQEPRQERSAARGVCVAFAVGRGRRRRLARDVGRRARQRARRATLLMQHQCASDHALRATGGPRGGIKRDASGPRAQGRMGSSVPAPLRKDARTRGYSRRRVRNRAKRPLRRRDRCSWHMRGAFMGLTTRSGGARASCGRVGGGGTAGGAWTRRDRWPRYEALGARLRRRRAPVAR